MEVHQHTHTPRKKWTHYLWEFFMLFLAVFCGFLAENQREHFVEHRREKQYMRSLVKDLQYDTSKIRSAIESNNNLIAGLNSLASILDYTVLTDSLLKEIYMTNARCVWSGSGNIVSFTERTISQLKSTGGLRVIRKQEVSDGITYYYEQVSFCNQQAVNYKNDLKSIIELSYKLFDNNYSRTLHVNMRVARQLLTNNPFMVREYLNRILDASDDLESYDVLLKSFLNSPELDLISLLKKEYHLK